LVSVCQRRCDIKLGKIACRLPIPDVTRPAFYANDWQQEALVREFVQGESTLSRALFRLPKPFRAAITNAVFKDSLLGPEIQRARSRFQSR